MSNTIKLNKAEYIAISNLRVDRVEEGRSVYFKVYFQGRHIATIDQEVAINNRPTGAWVYDLKEVFISGWPRFSNPTKALVALVRKIKKEKLYPELFNPDSFTGDMIDEKS